MSCCVTDAGMEMQRKLGAKIRKIRTRRGVTAKDFARAAGMSECHVGRIERGLQGIRVETLVNIARHLRVRPGTLLSASVVGGIDGAES
jgi:transcriptional regulator with XRE-family HTH domain